MMKMLLLLLVLLAIANSDNFQYKRVLDCI